MKRERKVQFGHDQQIHRDYIKKEKKILKIQSALLATGRTSLLISGEEDASIVYKTLDCVASYKRVAYVAVQEMAGLFQAKNLYHPRHSLAHMCSELVELDIVCIDARTTTEHFINLLEAIDNMGCGQTQGIVTLYLWQ